MAAHSPDHLILFTLLVRVVAMASVASVLVASKTFRRLLFADHKPISDRLGLVVMLASPFVLGVFLRVALGYQGMDLTMEAAFLIGMVAGPLAGMAAAGLIALPGLAAGEFLTPLVAGLHGTVGGMIFLFQSQRERFQLHPLLPLQIYRSGRDYFNSGKRPWILLAPVFLAALQVLYLAMANAAPAGRLFALHSDSPWMEMLTILVSVTCIAIPLKIWDNAWLEQRWQEQEHQLTKARLQTLRSQINPHFLFNTLNTILAMIRVNPEGAREMVLRLAAILRTIFKETDEFKPLYKELELIDSYLAIEESRFGRDKLRIVREHDETVSHVRFPTMLLQPLVENCVLHGLAQKVSGGQIRISTRREQHGLCVEIQDDGVGLEMQALGKGQGIGLSNVRERLRTLYGEKGHLDIESHLGLGTCFRVSIPLESSAEMTT